ncbi:MAG: TlpA family protein disulfide reductase [Pseudomonadales bacterium]|nr:TlpA family protein disulfide reductase [Pseudomonadales bacterium]
MQKIKLAILCLLLLVMSACGQVSSHEFSDGGEVNLEDLQGTWLFINYWAEWCAPCREEIPELNLLYADYGQKEILLTGVNYDGLQGEALVHVIDKMGIEFPVFIQNPGYHWNVALPQILPSTLVVNPDGELIAELVGPQTAESLLATMRSPHTQQH